MDSSFSVSSLVSQLQRNERAADTLLRDSCEDGFVECDSKNYYAATIKGNALAQATLAKPIKRKSAESILSQSMERVLLCNSNSNFLYSITRVVLFGSMLSGSQG